MDSHAFLKGKQHSIFHANILLTNSEVRPNFLHSFYNEARENYLRGTHEDFFNGYSFGMVEALEKFNDIEKAKDAKSKLERFLKAAVEHVLATSN